MNPLTSLLLGGLFNVGGGLLGGLFGRGQANRQEAYRQQILRALSPANAMNLTHQFYNQFLGGPAYTSAAQGAYARGNVLQNNLASSLAARGLGTSGIGSIAGPLAANAAGGYLGQARLGGYEGAQQSAMGAIRNQLAGLQAAGPQGPNPVAQGLGGGLSDFGSLLSNYFLGQGGAGGGMGQNYGLPRQSRGGVGGFGDVGGGTPSWIWSMLQPRG